MIEIQWIMCCLSSVFSFSRSHHKKKGSTDRYGHYLKGKGNEKSLIDSEIIYSWYWSAIAGVFSDTNFSTISLKRRYFWQRFVIDTPVSVENSVKKYLEKSVQTDEVNFLLEATIK